MKKLYLVLLFIILKSCSISAQDWHIMGPPVGNIRALAFNPLNSDNLYVGTEKGIIFRSNDSGNTTELFFTLLSQYADITVHPIDPDIIFISSNRTTDGGKTWHQINGGIQYVINPGNPSILYAINGFEVKMSRDGGENWNTISTISSFISKIAISPSDTNILYISSIMGDNVLKSSDSGLSWEDITETLGDIGVVTFEINTLDPNAIYLSTRYEGLLRTVNSGKTWWNIINFPHPSEYAVDIEINPLDTSIVYIITKSAEGTNKSNVYKTTNSGRNWTIKNEGLHEPFAKTFTTFVMNPEKPNELYLGTSKWGVFKTTDGGDHWIWTNLTAGEVLDIEFDPEFKGRIYTAAENIISTTDYGEHWNVIDLGIELENPTTFYDYVIHPRNHNLRYIVGGRNGLLKSTDSGNNWNIIFHPSPYEYSVSAVAVHPSNPDTVYVAQYGSSEGVLYRSLNGGLSWEEVGIPRPSSYCNKILFDPQNPQIIYIANSGRGILKTTDDGNTWNYMNNGLEMESATYVRPVIALSMNKDDTQILYAALRLGGAYMSTNGGGSWNLISENIDIFEQEQGLTVRDILVSSMRPENIYVSVEPEGSYGWPSLRGGLFRTRDNGETWERLYAYRAGIIRECSHRPADLFFSTLFGIVQFTDTTLTSVSHLNIQNTIKDYVFNNYPNPCNQGSKILYSIPEHAWVQIIIYNQLGREVIELVNEQKSKGMHTVHWNCKNSQGGDVASGIYVCSMKCDSIYRSHKMIVMR